MRSELGLQLFSRRSRRRESPQGLRRTRRRPRRRRDDVAEEAKAANLSMGYDRVVVTGSWGLCEDLLLLLLSRWWILLRVRWASAPTVRREGK